MPKRQPNNRPTSCAKHSTTPICAAGSSTPHSCSLNSKPHCCRLVTTTFSSWSSSTTWEVIFSWVRTRELLQRWHSKGEEDDRCIRGCPACPWNYTKDIPAYHSWQRLHTKPLSWLLEDLGRHNFYDEGSAKSPQRSFLEILLPQNVQRPTARYRQRVRDIDSRSEVSHWNHSHQLEGINKFMDAHRRRKG